MLIPVYIIDDLMRIEREIEELLKKQDSERPKVEIDKADSCEDCWPYRCKCK